MTSQRERRNAAKRALTKRLQTSKHLKKLSKTISISKTEMARISRRLQIIWKNRKLVKSPLPPEPFVSNPMAPVNYGQR